MKLGNTENNPPWLRFIRSHAMIVLPALCLLLRPAVFAQNLVQNGDFTANAALFTLWPGGITTAGNPTSITSWINYYSASGQGINGDRTGVGDVFGPTAAGGRTYAFLQGGVNNLLAQYLTLATNATYRLEFDVAARAGYGGNYRVVVAKDASGVGPFFYDSGSVVGNSAAFDHIITNFTTSSVLGGNPNIELINSSSAGDKTVVFANVKLVRLPETLFPAAGQGVPMDQAALLTLSWAQVTNAIAYDGYLGTVSNSVATATTNTAGVYLGRTSAFTLNAGTLQPNTTYFWRVDGMTAAGALIKGAVVSFSTGNAMVDLMMDTWVATDALNRTLPGHAETGSPRSDRPIGIFYFLWHNTNSLGNDGPRDNTREILRLGGYADPHNPWASNPLWMTGGEGRSWYWGEPEAGYYGNDDEWVIRRHVAMLEAAGVDALGFDNTNGDPAIYERNYLKILAVIRKMQLEGTPVHLKIFFYTKAGSGGSPATVTWLYDHFYKPGLYPDLWFQWQGKPLVIGYPNGEAGDGSTPVSSEVLNFFTWRTGWANVGTTLSNEWQWIDTPTPQNFGWNGRSDIPEQFPVACGGWANGNGQLIGRSNTNRSEPAYDSFHLTTGRTQGQGLYFKEQSFYGLKVDPEFLWITGWNEWWAGAWTAPSDGYTTLLDDWVKTGQRFFVDNYNAEFSRDIEPMKGGFTDNYYYQMVANNRLRKGARPVPMASAAKTINLAGDFSDWADVGPEFRDLPGDTLARNWPTTFGNLPNYTDNTGRNDFTLLKVARDANNIYFLAQCRSNLTSYTGTNWMNLFINIDQSRTTGWEGYDFAVNLGTRTATTTTLSQNTGTTWNWTTVRSDIAYKATGNQLMLAIPRAALGLANDPATFDFHWADNFQTNDISGFFQYGDSAPDRRFNYRYQASVGPTITLRQDNFDSGKQTWWDESWTNASRWSITALDSYTGSSAVCSTINGSSQNMLVTRVDTSSLESLRVSFRYKLSNVLDAQNFNLQFYSTNNTWVTIRDLGRDQYYPAGQAWSYDERQNVWLLCTDARAKSGTNAAFFHKNFAVRINGSGVTSGKTAWIDDFQITGVVAAASNRPPVITMENLVSNGDFTANAASFGTSPGYTGGANPASITGWNNINGLGVGVNGAAVSFAAPNPFAPVNDGGRTYAFIQGGVNGLSQNLALTPGTTYQLNFDAAARAGNSAVFRVQIGDASQVYVSSGNLNGNTNAFTHYSYTFTAPGAFDGTPSIQLYNLTSGDNTMNFATIITAVSLRTIVAGQTLTIANTATDPDVPAQTLTWSLLTAPTNAFLNSSSGEFTWRPTIAQSPSSNFISLRVTDSGTPNLSATQSFSVFVLRPIAPMLGAATMSNGVFALGVSGDAGPDYLILTSTNLVQWTPFMTTNPPALPFWITDPAAQTNDHRFYRVLLGP